MADNYLTIDVEEYFEEAPAEVAAGCVSRLEDEMHRCLDILESTSNGATFFFLASRAKEHPSLVKEVIKAGHEVASHGLDHLFFDKLPQEQQIQQAQQSIEIISDIAGEGILGFRAPYFSVKAKNCELLRELAASGIRYDSSVFPVHHPDYGWPGTPHLPYRIDFGDEVNLLEIPPTTMSVAGLRTGVGGGGYLRIYPFWMTKNVLNSRVRRGEPLVVYFHPWELDPRQPRLRLKLRFPLRHYINLSTTEKRVKWVLENYDFSPCRDALNGTEFDTHDLDSLCRPRR
ncbi:MAG: polysaccharide deacetylase family protein [Planctomycetota bacterium]|nr:polysaccharide deacetylase family protein [Planctomycetota bacterium]